MTELLTAAQMRALEAAAIAAGEVTGLELMERAGRGVVEAVLAEWPDMARAPHRAVVLCGPGNNGGDGFVVARLLKERGWEVEVFLYGEADRLPPDAREMCRRWQGFGTVAGWNPEAILAVSADLYVDAVFGAGLTRRLPEAVGAAFSALHTSRRSADRMVAIDAPSGLCMDSGRDLDPARGAVHAALTVTFHAPRRGHHLSEGPAFCGRVVVCDIGLRPAAVPDGVRLLTAPRRGDLAKTGACHKFSHGHALILSGPATRTGAARLAARGALRIGAGLVTVGAPGEALAEHAARLDAVMLQEVGDGAALAKALADARITALCLGPGLGLDDRAAGLVAAALAGRGMPRRGVVLDADALTLLSRDPALFGMLHDGCVLTPHAGEFARLFPDLAARLAEPATAGPAWSKVDATREAAARAGCVVLHKGPDTVIADPSGRTAINSAHYDRAAPWLATAGSGDVLAGFITGLLARGFAPFGAACTAAWLHVEAARAFGPGLIAEDLPEMLPKVFRALGV